MSALILLPGCGKSGSGSSASENGVLRIGIVPYDQPGKLQEEYAPFANYLAGKVGEKAKVFVTQDYSGVAPALQANQIDVAYLNPLSFVLFEQRLASTPQKLVLLGMPEVHGSLYYYGIIVARKDSGITSVAGLKGKKVAFSDATSTSGYLYPYQYMLAHGVNPDKDLAQKVFAGTTGVIPAVLNKTVDAGAVFKEGLTLFANPAQRQQLVTLAQVGPIANGMLVARGNLDPATLAKLQSAMQQINTDPAAKSALISLQVTKWDAPDDTVFNPVRAAAKVLGVNIASMDKKK